MVAQAGQDVAATSVEPFFFYDSSATEYVGYIYTDRPVYRPTHEVNFKGIVRAQPGGTFSSGRSGPGHRGDHRSQSERPSISRSWTLAVRSFHGKFTLSPLAALGTYSIIAHLGDKSVYGTFEVQEYKKPEFEVSVSTDKARYLQGETIQATISARYYFGAPVANGQVKYSVFRSGYHSPIGESCGATKIRGRGGRGRDNEDYFGQEISQGTGQLDADGVLHVSLPTEVDADKRDYRYRIEAHVTDASNREIMGGRGVPSPFPRVVVLLETDRYVYTPGQQAEITVRTLDYDSNPVSTSVQLNLKATGAGASSAAAEKFFREASVSTDANGTGHYTYTVPKVPWLTVRAERHRPQPARSELRKQPVDGRRRSFAEAEAEFRRVDIYPDKHSYKPGDTAHVLIVTHAAGSAGAGDHGGPAGLHLVAARGAGGFADRGHPH